MANVNASIRSLVNRWASAGAYNLTIKGQERIDTLKKHLDDYTTCKLRKGVPQQLLQKVERWIKGTIDRYKNTIGTEKDDPRYNEHLTVLDQCIRRLGRSDSREGYITITTNFMRHLLDDLQDQWPRGDINTNILTSAEKAYDMKRLQERFHHLETSAPNALACISIYKDFADQEKWDECVNTYGPEFINVIARNIKRIDYVLDRLDITTILRVKNLLKGRVNEFSKRTDGGRDHSA